MKWRFSLLGVLVVMVLCSGQQCGQPAASPDSGGQAVTPLCHGGYRNDDWGFSFDPPPGFFGPRPGAHPGEHVLSSTFAPASGAPVLHVWIDDLGQDMESAVALYNAVRINEGLTLLTQQRATMPTGVPSIFQEWGNSATGQGTIEIYAESGGLLYQLFVYLEPQEIGAYEQAIVASFNSLCVE
jgi:hypothetical protein